MRENREHTNKLNDLKTDRKRMWKILAQLIILIVVLGVIMLAVRLWQISQMPFRHIASLLLHTATV